MNIILKFPKLAVSEDFLERLEQKLRATNLNESMRRKISEFVAEIRDELKTPDLPLRIKLPDGLTNEQINAIQAEVVREFSTYYEKVYKEHLRYIQLAVFRKFNL